MFEVLSMLFRRTRTVDDDKFVVEMHGNSTLGPYNVVIALPSASISRDMLDVRQPQT